MGNAAFEITARSEFVHVELVPGFEISLDSMRGMWRDVPPICEQRNALRVLVEGNRPTRSMRKIEAFEHGRIVADLYLRGFRVAFCLYEYQPDQLSHLFTTVASGGFNSARFFSNLDESMRWLRI